MFGNLLRESGVAERLGRAAARSIVDVATLFLGVTTGATMEGPTSLAAMGPNVAGVIGTAVAAGVFLALLR